MTNTRHNNLASVCTEDVQGAIQCNVMGGGGLEYKDQSVTKMYGSTDVRFEVISITKVVGGGEGWGVQIPEKNLCNT